MQEALVMEIFWHCYSLQCANNQLIILVNLEVYRPFNIYLLILINLIGVRFITIKSVLILLQKRQIAIIFFCFDINFKLKY